ncbi:MAG: hypothetical protein LBI29_02445 [Rickettsiales bacterium]|jgi:hypothetical protein|nr:hypothetical protein [Rickettsiales bacterium]
MLGRNRIGRIVFGVALVASVVARSEVKIVNVEQMENGATKFSCEGADLSLTKTAKKKLRYVDGRLTMESKTLELGEGSHINDIVIQDYVNINGEMVDEEIEKAMEGICSAANKK